MKKMNRINFIYNRKKTEPTACAAILEMCGNAI